MNARVLGISFDPEKVNQAERSGIDNSAAYLKSWLSALPEAERKPELMSAIGSAQKISDYVLSFAMKLEEQLDQQDDERSEAQPEPSALASARYKVKI
ncbi:MAG: hypothetical protein HKL81_10745 [Acidimicrobiaceae bacterium]|nr:hypothetical protein [Acidimicrobiaceae bacterium]